MTRTRIAPRTYQDEQMRYWARFPVNRRYTWRLLAEAKNKRDAIAIAQTCAAHRADSFAALAKLYEDAGCPTRKFEARTASFITGEKARLRSVVEWFGPLRPGEIRLPLIPKYAAWRIRRNRTKGGGHRAVDVDLATLSNVIQYGIALGIVDMNYIRHNRPVYRRAPDVVHARERMPADAATVHTICEYFLDSVRSEVMAWLSLFQVFTGCRTSELLRLRLDAPPKGAGDISDGYLHLGRRSKSGVNPWVKIGPEFEQCIACFRRWHAARHPRSKVYFCGPDGEVLNKCSHARAMARACRELSLTKITPHGFRAYYVTKRRREGVLDSLVAAEIGDKTVALISTTYGESPGGAPLHWKPAGVLPAWLRWQPEAQKIAKLGT